jgi:hypothetical protein
MLTRCLLVACCALPFSVACARDPAPAPGAPDAAGGAIVDAAPGAPDAAPGVPDAGPAGARLTGVISRSAMPTGDAKGNIYVAVFDKDPIANQSTAKVVGNALVLAADLSATATKIPYTVEGVPPRAEAYYLIGFLDDNGNVDMSNPAGAGPDKGDLVSLMGVSAPKVTLDTAGDHPHDIDLNLVMPF